MIFATSISKPDRLRSSDIGNPFGSEQIEKTLFSFDACTSSFLDEELHAIRLKRQITIATLFRESENIKRSSLRTCLFQIFHESAPAICSFFIFCCQVMRDNSADP